MKNHLWSNKIVMVSSLALSCLLGASNAVAVNQVEWKRMLAQGRFQDLIELADDALAKARDHNAIYYKALALYKMGEATAARQLFGFIANYYTEHADLQVAHHRRAMSLYYSGQFELAVDAFEDYIKTQGPTLEALLHLGYSHSRMGDYHKAIVAYNKVLEVDERYSVVYNRAMAYLSAEMTEEAIVDLNRTIELNPDFTRPYIDLVSLYFDQENLDQAIRWVKALVTVNSEALQALEARTELQELFDSDEYQTIKSTL